MSASGQNSDGTDITQTGYDLTQDKNNNIFAITANQIAGYKGTNADQGYTSSGYTTAVGGEGVRIVVVLVLQVLLLFQWLPPNANRLKTDASSSNTAITLSQNYLPLGITSAVKDAYFNHNGVIWHYHNGPVDNDGKGVYIEGYVNTYIGGSIQPQGNGVGGLADSVNTSSGGVSGTGTSILNSNDFLAAGVYNNGAGLTSVGGTGRHVIKPAAPNTVDNPNPTINLFGGKVKNVDGSLVSATGDYFDGRSNGTGSVVSTNIVAPSNVQVKLTLVPGTSSNNPIR